MNELLYTRTFLMHWLFKCFDTQVQVHRYKLHVKNIPVKSLIMMVGSTVCYYADVGLHVCTACCQVFPFHLVFGAIKNHSIKPLVHVHLLLTGMCTSNIDLWIIIQRSMTSNCKSRQKLTAINKWSLQLSGQNIFSWNSQTVSAFYGK